VGYAGGVVFNHLSHSTDGSIARFVQVGHSTQTINCI